MSVGGEINALPGQDHAARKYDRKMARWRHVVDWAKERPWAMRLVGGPLSRGTGRFRFVDRFTDHATPAPVTPDFSHWGDATLAACWIGHATTLLRVGGLTLLTDPVFSSRVGLGWGFGTLGPARFVKPAVRLRDLPPVDVVLLSHAHFDHLDRPTLSRLPKASTVICADGTGDLANDLGFRRVYELKLGESMTLPSSVGQAFLPVHNPPAKPTPSPSDGFADGGQDRQECLSYKIRITAVPVRHWGARTILDGNRGYCAYLIEASDGRRVLYGGDSAHQEYWKPIGEQGGVDLAIVGIGAYDPWIGGHANPEQAWQMAADAGARKVLPMHHRTFKLSNEPMTDPLDRLLAAAGDRAGDVVCRRIGEQWSEL